VKKEIARQERVLARALAEKELKAVQGADTVVITQHAIRDITDSNNGDTI